MAFRKLSLNRPGRATSPDVRVVNNNGDNPRILLPVNVLDALGTKIGGRVDFMIDDDVTPHRLAVLSPGRTSRIGASPGKGGMIAAAVLRTIIPKCGTTRVDHEITKIDGHAAVVFTVPSKGAENS